jgi:hypothetical protein
MGFVHLLGIQPDGAREVGQFDSAQLEMIYFQLELLHRHEQSR